MFRLRSFSRTLSRGNCARSAVKTPTFMVQRITQWVWPKYRLAARQSAGAPFHCEAGSELEMILLRHQESSNAGEIWGEDGLVLLRLDGFNRRAGHQDGVLRSGELVGLRQLNAGRRIDLLQVGDEAGVLTIEGQVRE